MAYSPTKDARETDTKLLLKRLADNVSKLACTNCNLSPKTHQSRPNCPQTKNHETGHEFLGCDVILQAVGTKLWTDDADKAFDTLKQTPQTGPQP